MEIKNRPRLLKSSKFMLWLFTLTSVIILAGGALFYHVQKKELIKKKGLELSSVADLKVQQLDDYRKERFSEARFLFGNQTFIKTVKDYIESSDTAQEKEIKDWIMPILANHSYSAISIVDAKTKKNVLIYGNDQFFNTGNIESEAVSCSDSGKILFGLLTSHPKGVFLPLFAPLSLSQGRSSKKVAVVVFIIDPVVRLFNLMESFPSKNKTGEILVVRKEGDSILFLNELRFKKSTALNFRIPAQDEVLSLLENKDLVIGKDYRGKKVLAVARAVPDSPWTLIAKIDSTEVLRGLFVRAILTFGTAAVLIIITGLIFLNLWNRKNLEIYKDRIKNLNTINRLSRVYKLLNNLNKSIIKNTEKEKLLNEVCRIIFNEGEYSLCWIGVLNAGNGLVECVAECGTEKNYIEKIKFSLVEKTNGGKDYSGDLLTLNTRFVSNDIWNDPKLENWREKTIPHKFKSMAIFSLIQKSGTTGTLNLFSQKPGFFKDDEIELIDGLCRDLSYALDKIDVEKSEETIKKNLLDKERELLNTNEELKESNERIKKVNHELITAREKAEESDRLKSAFLANMSHEIRTPMNAIIGFSDLMNKNGITKTEIKEFTSIIVNKSNELLQLLNDIVDISKIESNTVTLNMETFSLQNFLHEIFLIYHKRLEQNGKNIKLIYKLPQQTEQLLISTDSFKLRQIFTNLIENALKFTDEGEIVFGCKSINNNHLICFVSDTGCGIEEKYQESIFKIFRQADNQLYSNNRGTGLGLAICRGNAHLLGGDIWVRSTPGKGSWFYFCIKNNHEVYAINTQTIAPRNITIKDKTILLVEDDVYTVEYIKKILSGNGINIHVATNGKETQEYFKKLDLFDMVLLDMRLPDASGIDLVKQIKALRKDLPVIAQTAFAMQEDRKKCLEAGCDEYISKPFKGEQIIELLNLFTGSRAKVV